MNAVACFSDSPRARIAVAINFTPYRVSAEINECLAALFYYYTAAPNTPGDLATLPNPAMGLFSSGGVRHPHLHPGAQQAFRARGAQVGHAQHGGKAHAVFNRVVNAQAADFPCLKGEAKSTGGAGRPFRSGFERPVGPGRASTRRKARATDCLCRGLG